MSKQKIKCLECASLMEEILTRKGILIDICPSCQGVWMDQGELTFFSKDKRALKKYTREGLENTQKTEALCSRCESHMQTGRIPALSYQVIECLSCKGIFFSKNTFKKIQGSGNFSSLREDSSGVLGKRESKKYFSPIRTKLPSLSLAMGGTCVSLYGILIAVFVFIMEMTDISPVIGSLVLLGFILLQFYFSPIILDIELRVIGSMYWKDLQELPAHFQKSLLKLCKENHLPLPRVGIIRDRSPQAYTYGRTPRSARLIFSEGMFELLDEEELEAVLAHELGHIKNWDFLIMTLVMVVPILLYHIYRICKDSLSTTRSSSKEANKGKGALAVIMVVCYIAYLISEYLVLFVSRIREYYADRFSCFATKKPHKLLTALVRISYGLTALKPDTAEDSDGNKIRNFQSLNIMNMSRSKEVVLSHQVEQEEGLNLQAIKEAMRWGLWNPWAAYYELNSTHPLTAKRINAINTYTLAMNQKPYFLFNEEKPESYWDDFFADLIVLSLPYVLGFGFLLSWAISYFIYDYNFVAQVSNSSMTNVLLGFVFCFSLGALIRTKKSYPGEGPSSFSVASLLKLIKVSPVRSYYVSMKGYILGRGDAGNIFSEDLILKDKTGIIFLNHEPFGLNILFALLRYKKFQGKEVLITGWYRRSPSPYIEIENIKTKDTQSKAYTYYYKTGLCFLGLLIPVICLLVV